MPQRMAADDVVPGTYSGQWCVDDDEFLHPLRVLGCERIADQVANIVGNKIDLIDLQRIEQAGNVFALGFLVVASSRP